MKLIQTYTYIRDCYMSSWLSYFDRSYGLDKDTTQNILTHHRTVLTGFDRGVYSDTWWAKNTNLKK